VNPALTDTGVIVAPNRLGEVRRAAGLSPLEVATHADLDPTIYEHLEAGRLMPTKDELTRLCAALGGVSHHELYVINLLQLMAADENYSKSPPAKHIQQVAGAKELFVARDEVTWSEKRARPNRPVDAFLSMSCGTQAAPHLLLDTVSVCQALGISYVASAGPAGCCGKPYAANAMTDVAESWSRAKTDYAVQIGASEIVVWCTACHLNATTLAARREVLHGVQHPVRETQILRFLAERIAAMGDRVPWKKEVHRRVLAEGHTRMSPVHAAALQANAKLLQLIPGVTFAGRYDGYSPESPCAGAAREESYGEWRRDKTTEDINEHREILADMAESKGADTIACQHQGCHMAWGRYATDRLAVRHAVSIVAEALGVDHPDRYQAASRLGDPRDIVEQTRSIWTTWGLTAERALELSQMVADERFAAGVTACACGKGGDGCQERLISVDVLTGRAPGLAAPA
jgi:Fe-S oxidoreductase